jgi:hypothetical protein
MPTTAKQRHIDIPVKLTDAKVALSVAALSFEGDLPAPMFHLQRIEHDVADRHAKAPVMAVFHTTAGHVTVHDTADDHDRGIATGNPYKALPADWMKRGAPIALCGATAKAHDWGNADRLPGIKINTGAITGLT